MKKSSPQLVQDKTTWALDIVLDIVKELTRIQSMPTHLINEDHPFPIPGFIAVDSDKGIFISHKIDACISLLATHLMREDELVRSNFTQNEWISTVRKKFGPALASIDLDDDLQKNARTVLAAVYADAENAKSPSGCSEHIFGCTLFSHSNAPAIKIGPATLESRLDWLTRSFEGGIISKTTYRRLHSRWLGRRPRKRKRTRDSINEDAIAQAIGDCSYVCSVKVDGLAMQASQQRALMAARMALTATALLWETPSKALKGFNLRVDQNPETSETLVIIPGNLLSGRTRLRMPHGPWIRPEDWEALYARKFVYFSGVQEILEHFLSPTGLTKRPRLMSTLFQAMLWLHEGCREDVGAIAIVKFSASLDALSMGKGSNGICQLIRSRLGIQAQSAITKDGRTVTQVIDEIYGKGRSRTVHGTNENIAHDWTGTRNLAEQLARWCLLSSIDWATTHKNLDDPRALLR